MASKQASGGGAEKSAPLYPKGTYKCPKCSNRIEMLVRMTAPPVCGKHSTGAVIMEVIK